MPHLPSSNLALVMTDIIGFNGPPRSGKTAGVAYTTLWYLRHGYHAFTNFEIYHRNAEMIEPRDLVTMLKEAMDWREKRPMYYRTVLAAQEIYGWLESRTSTDKAVMMLGYFVFYSGKMGISIIYDAQLNSSIDKRLKYNATKRYLAENRKDRFVYHELDLEHTEENIPTGKKWSLKKAYAQKAVFPFYNTYKVSKPVGFDAWLAKCNL